MGKIDLIDATFLIPVEYDSPDRKENLDLVVGYLQKYFTTNIIVCENINPKLGYVPSDDNSRDYPLIEHLESKFTGLKYMRSNSSYFHKTKMLNDMARVAETPIIISYDGDVFASPVQILESVDRIRNNEADCVLAYDGRCAKVPRLPWLQRMQQYLTVAIFGDRIFPGMNDRGPQVGGLAVMSKEKFFESGGENENFVSWGSEDFERKIRWEKFGYRFQRVDGILYHMEHMRGTNSWLDHPNYHKNKTEYEKVERMTGDELREYIKTWSWLTAVNL